MKILIIDSKDNKLLYRQKFLGTKVQARVVSDLEEAVKYLNNFKYDLVLLSSTFKGNNCKSPYETILESGFSGKLVITYSGAELENKNYYNKASGSINRSINSKDFMTTISDILSSDVKIHKESVNVS